LRSRLATSITIVAIVAVSVLPLLTLAGPIPYGHSWGTNDNERATAVVVDGAGDVFIAGNQQNLTTFEQRGFVAKFGPSGNLLWNRVFPFDVNTSVDMSLATGGDVYALGMKTTSFSVPAPNGTYNVSIPASFVARISADGSLVFAENITEIVYPQRIATDPLTEGFVVVGRGSSYANGIVAAFTSNGSLRWVQASGTAAGPAAIAVDGAGRSFVLFDRFNGNSAVDAFDTNGTLLGQSVIGSYYTTPVYPSDLIATASGPLVLGYTSGGIFLSQLSSSLSASWTMTIQGIGWNDFPVRAIELSDGSIEVLTLSSSQANSTYASNVYHLSSAGAVLDGSSYLSPASGQGLGPGFVVYAGAAMPNGAFVFAGLTLGPSPQTSSPVNLSTGSVSVSWSGDSLGWSAQNLTLHPITDGLLDPAVPVDNFSETAAYQAWWGVTNLPASKLLVSISTKQSNSSSPTITFSASVSGGHRPYNFTWSFGDGTFGTGSSTTHTYPGAGRYLAQVTVEDSGGLTGYGSTLITVTGPPVILSIQQYPSTPYAGDYVSFYANALDPDGGAITSYAWNWGDGSSDSTPYNGVSHIYRSPGNYTMTLTVTDSDQGLTALASRIVRVLQRPDAPPVASFFVGNRPTVGSPTYFYAYYSYDPDGYITEYRWSFGDGATFNSTDYFASHVYGAAGNYTVSLTVVDNAGLTGTQNQTLQVQPDLPPVAEFFWYPQVPFVNSTVFFNAGYQSYDPDGYIVSWQWDFGDGSGSGGNGTGNFTGGTPYPTHVYAAFGSYLVRLVVTDNAGLNATANHTVYVNAPPVAVITPSRSVGKVGTPIIFSANASHDPDDRITSYAWHFSDGSTSPGSWVVHVFASPGQYDVTLVVTDVYNATGFADLSYSVILPKSPVSVMAWSPSRPLVGQTVTFDASNSLDPDGAITTYIWEFGDGTVGRGLTASHNYTDAGTYTIELVVVDEDGFSDRDVQTITVLARSKGAVLAAGSGTPIEGAQITLTQGGMIELETSTAADGTFSLEHLAPGAYAITIRKEGYQPYQGTLVWDGLNGDLGIWRLTSLAAQGSGLRVEPIWMVGIVAIVASLIGVALYRARTRNARKPRGKR